MRNFRLPPAFLLFVLSSLLAEMVSGTLPFQKFFHPLTLFATLMPYGAGVLIARELTVRYRKGWLSLLVFGMAFGVFFEGIVTRVFVNPANYPPPMVEYGFRLGWNLPIAIGLAHFHAAVAIVSPVFIVEMLYPSRRHESWISTRALVDCCLALPLWTFVLGIFAPYVPSPAVAASVLGVTAALLVLGLALPEPSPAPRRWRRMPPIVVGAVSAAGMLLLMATAFAAPASAAAALPPLSAWLAMIAGILILELALLAGFSTAAGFGDRHRLAMVAGFLAFFVLMVAAEDVKADIVTARSAVSLATVLFLLWLRWKIGRREPAAGVPAAA